MNGTCGIRLLKAKMNLKQWLRAWEGIGGGQWAPRWMACVETLYTWSSIIESIVHHGANIFKNI